MVLDKIIALVAQQFTVDEDELSEDTAFADLDAEELDITDLVYAVEDEFEIDISEEQANALETIADLADLVEAAMNAD
ncbi:MAG: phosphopantetheine-binding protein [Oscillospiraceae bacterium]|nr:phosphopantetheine-binding protein [Oscillospiraceae bacterium]